MLTIFNKNTTFWAAQMIISLTLLCSCQTEVKEKNVAKPKILLITENSVDEVKLGMDWKKFFNKYDNQFDLDSLPNSAFNLNGGGNGILVSEGNEKMFFVYSKAPDSTKVGGIIVLSDRCRTREGLYIGMKMDQLSTIFPDLNLRPNQEPPPQEVFTPEKYQVIKGKRNHSVFTIGIQSEDGKLLGKYEEDGDYIETGTLEFSHNGFVATIELHSY